MSGTVSRSFDEPDESLAFDHGRIDWVVIGDRRSAGRSRARLEVVHHIRPIVGGEWCQSRHVGVIISGRMHIVMEEGEEFEFGSQDVIDIAPGHDAWVVGDEPVVAVEWSGVEDGSSRSSR